jgi:light-regulated signal transduction histidine kinase (bacteriophytochrome)
MERSEMRHERVNVSALVRSLAKESEQSDPERKVEFVLEDGIVVEGDQRLLRVVLETCYATRGNSSAISLKRVEFGLTEIEGTPMYFVRDNGVDSDMAYAVKLLGAFQRLHRTSEFSGTGIRLATVQRRVRRHGGSVWAERVVGQGATFYFTL